MNLNNLYILSEEERYYIFNSGFTQGVYHRGTKTAQEAFREFEEKLALRTTRTSWEGLGVDYCQKPETTEQVLERISLEKLKGIKHNLSYLFAALEVKEDSPQKLKAHTLAMMNKKVLYPERYEDFWGFFREVEMSSFSLYILRALIDQKKSKKFFFSWFPQLEEIEPNPNVKIRMSEIPSSEGLKKWGIEW